MYTYRCMVLRVIDGDTVDVGVDLGFNIHFKNRFRLFGIDAPEKNTPEGKAARDYLVTMMPPGSDLLVTTEKDKTEKYGRYLGTFSSLETAFDSKSINQLMVEAGHAVERVY